MAPKTTKEKLAGALDIDGGAILHVKIRAVLFCPETEQVVYSGHYTDADGNEVHVVAQVEEFFVDTAKALDKLVIVPQPDDTDGVLEGAADWGMDLLVREEKFPFSRQFAKDTLDIDTLSADKRGKYWVSRGAPLENGMCAYAIPGYHDLPDKMEKYGGFVIPPSMTVVMFDDSGEHMDRILSSVGFKGKIIPVAIVKSEAESSLIDAYIDETSVLDTEEDEFKILQTRNINIVYDWARGVIDDDAVSSQRVKGKGNKGRSRDGEDTEEEDDETTAALASVTRKGKGKGKGKGTPRAPSSAPKSAPAARTPTRGAPTRRGPRSPVVVKSAASADRRSVKRSNETTNTSSKKARKDSNAASSKSAKDEAEVMDIGMTFHSIKKGLKDVFKLTEGAIKDVNTYIDELYAQKQAAEAAGVPDVAAFRLIADMSARLATRSAAIAMKTSDFSTVMAFAGTASQGPLSLENEKKQLDKLGVDGDGVVAMVMERSDIVMDEIFGEGTGAGAGAGAGAGYTRRG